MEHVRKGEKEMEALDYKIGDLITKGKTKFVYENELNPDTYIMEFTDDITAGEGTKHEVIPGKGRVDWLTNSDIMELLRRHGIPMAYLGSPAERIAIVSKVDAVLKFEVVMRRIATGSILELLGDTVKEGDVFDPPLLQFFFKDDLNHDPLLDKDFILYLDAKKNPGLYTGIAQLALRQFLIMEAAFAMFGVQYIDNKIEIGLNLKSRNQRGDLIWCQNGEIILIDELTSGSFRLWPYTDGVIDIDLEVQNAMDQLNKGGMLDKQVFRDGAGTDETLSKFKHVAAITKKFVGLELNVSVPQVSLKDLFLV